MKIAEGDTRIIKKDHELAKKQLLEKNDLEIDQLRGEHKKRLEVTRAEQESSLFDSQLEYRARLGQTAQEGQEKLMQQGLRLSEEAKLIDEQKKKLDQSIQAQRIDHQYRLQTDQQQNETMLKIQMDQLLGKGSDGLQKARQEQEQQINSVRSEKQMNVAQALAEGDLRIQDLEGKYKQLEHGRSRERAQEITQQERTHGQKLLKQKIKYEHDLQNILKAQQKEMSTTQTLHLAQLDQEKNSFANKYKQLTELHHQALSRVQTQTDQEINYLLKENTALKDNFQTKSQDSFYRPNLLSPVVTDAKDHYVVSLQIPEHEKENVQINADGRNITLQVSRQYKQTVEIGDGNTNKSARSEVFAQTMNVKDIIDSRSIKQDYKDGYIHFLIKKA